MEMAWLKVSSLGDNSAARETNRALARLSEQQTQSQNISMMVALRCTNLPVGKLSQGLRYLGPALACNEKVIRFGQEVGLAHDACKRSDWKPADPR